MSKEKFSVSVFHDLEGRPDGEYELLPSRVSIFHLPNTPKAELRHITYAIEDEILATNPLSAGVDRLMPNDYDQTIAGRVIDPSAKLARLHNNLRQIAWVYELEPSEYDPRVILEENQDIPAPLDIRRISVCTSMGKKALMRIRGFNLRT